MPFSPPIPLRNNRAHVEVFFSVSFMRLTRLRCLSPPKDFLVGSFFFIAFSAQRYFSSFFSFSRWEVQLLGAKEVALWARFDS